MKKQNTPEVMKKITKGTIKMRSPLSLWVENLGIKSFIFLVLAALIPFVGVMILWSADNMDLFLPVSGKYGFLTLVESFPYLPIIAIVILFAVATLLLRRFDFSYKKPFLLILLCILLGTVLAGWFTRRWYEGSRCMMGARSFRGNNYLTGVVKKIDRQTLSVALDTDDEIPVITSDLTYYPYGLPRLNDTVRSMGYWKGKMFYAEGIRVYVPDRSLTPKCSRKGMRLFFP